ncbi:MAG: 2-succinyl-5-enolpyruvyl-6-hydroxy-3-cyclohexene-1-carboxylic-acid synthase [Muribaculaceae bacterium]|nr:2-succinyl-5-enolpyruvyl-6-hydroxy-3-cyclohexene-1-carboxylic-acid synthase [Muribaculaceae bacterium]
MVNSIADIIYAHGVRDVVVSPGSRNAPLIDSFASHEEFKTKVIVDERTAAFVALGISLATDRPVALVCTSGSAVLNYAPAVAEAFYRQVPLIVISADRPAQWIDQNDSQTIKQPRVLSNIVKTSVDIPADISTETDAWWSNRLLNDSMLTALEENRGPVHINVQISAEQLAGKTGVGNSRIISSTKPTPIVDDKMFDRLKSGSPRKIIIVGGFAKNNPLLEKSLSLLAEKENIVVLTESICNIRHDKFISAIDRTLSAITPEIEADICPEVVISFGGALVTRMLKQRLRLLKNVEHWHVGIQNMSIDCFTSLSQRIETPADVFFASMAKALPDCKSDFSRSWHILSDKAAKSHNTYVDSVEWSDMTAYKYIFGNLPSNIDLHLSNGTPIRYAQLFANATTPHSFCNRGVSGIEGSTSTAIGMSMASNSPTMLISGDLSAFYDLSAFAIEGIGGNMKIVVMMNGGGSIFRFVKATRNRPTLDRYMAANPRFPIAKIADAFGFDYHECNSLDSIRYEWNSFVTENDKPAILAIFTDPIISTEILDNYFKFISANG